MNCNIYFFIGTQKGYSQYPDNYTKDIIANILAKTDRKMNNSQFAISINGKLAYMTYQYRYSDSKYFGVCCEYNGVVPSNFEYLFEFYDNLMQDILKRGEIIHYDSSGTMCPSIDYISDKVELINYYCNFISHNFDDELAKYIALPSQIYTSEKKKVATIAYGDAQEQLLDALNTYDNVIVSRENPYALGYANTLKKASDRISKLETELAKINRQKKQYRMVVFLVLAVAACLVALYSFNSNIKTLTGDLSQRQEEMMILNNDLTLANAKIDTMSIELSEKSLRIGQLQREAARHRNSIDSLNNLTQNQETIISDLRSDLSSANNSLSSKKSELSQVQKKLSNYQNKVGKHMPLVINNIELANYTANQGRVISDYGQRIYSNESRWVWFRINYDGIVSGTKKLHYKVYDQKGQLKTCSSSPSGYTWSSDIYIYGDNNNSVVLFGWGADNASTWSTGTYRIEIWYNDMCLKSKSFTIY